MWFNVSLLFLLFAAATSSSSDLVNHADADGSNEMPQHNPVKKLGPYAAAWKNLNKDAKQDMVMKLAQMIVAETFHQNQIKKLGDANVAYSLKADGPFLNEHQKKYHLRAKRAAVYTGEPSYGCYILDDNGQCWTKAQADTLVALFIVIPIIGCCCCIIIIGSIIYCVRKKNDPPPPPQIQYSATGPQFQPQVQYAAAPGPQLQPQIQYAAAPGPPLQPQAQPVAAFAQQTPYAQPTAGVPPPVQHV